MCTYQGTYKQLCQRKAAVARVNGMVKRGGARTAIALTYLQRSDKQAMGRSMNFEL